MRPYVRQPRREQRSGEQERRPDTYPLPQDSRALAETQASRCLNYGLRLERLLLCNERTWELTRPTKERQGVRAFHQGDLQHLISAHKKRWDAMLKDLRERGYTVSSFPMLADSRIIVGLGAESVLETSIRLHRLYGFPIIPGSALKGLARSYAELVERKNESDPTFAHVFGKSPPDARAGKVIFFDAVPADPANLKLDLDVMNPHYSDYYMKKTDRQGRPIPPADYLNPVPVFFVAIAPDSQFLFAVASKEPELAQRAQIWMQKGLQEMGVGAKTTSGYGLWR